MADFPVSVKLDSLKGLLRQVLTGYSEPAKSTNEFRTSQRRTNLIRACDQLLKACVGPGDLLSSSFRSQIAQEAYKCSTCLACHKIRGLCLPPNTNFAKMNNQEINHDYQTNKDGFPFRDVVHAICNLQSKLDEPYFEHVVQRFKKYHCNTTQQEQQRQTNTDTTTVNGASGPCNCLNGDDDSKFKAMAIELCLVAACCSGVKTFYKTAGMTCPPLPMAPDPPIPARFTAIAEYSAGPLVTDKCIAWGPVLPIPQLKLQEINKRYKPGMDMLAMSLCGPPEAPGSKASAVPTTCMDWKRFTTVVYASASDTPMFFKVPGDDRHLSRSQVEIAAAAYTTALQCRY